MSAGRRANAHGNFEVLASVSYFRQVPAADLTDLAAACRRLTLAAAETLFVEGEPCAGFYYVIAGRIRAVRYSPQGREFVLREFGPGETLNEVGVLESGINPSTAIAAEAAEVLLMPTAALRRLLAKHQDVDLQMLKGLAAKLHFLVAKLSQLALLDVRGRLIAYLLDHADQDNMVGPISQEDLAAQLGTVRQVLGRALADLQRAGAVQISRTHIEIRDIGRLQELATDR